MGILKAFVLRLLRWSLVPVAFGISYNETWDETKPAGTRDLSLGDDDIREHKRAIRERLATDHEFDDDEVGFTTIGYHKKTTFVVQSSDPTAVGSAFILYAKDASAKAQLYMEDEDGNVQQLTALVNSKLSFIGGIPGEVRMWSGTIANIPTGWVICDGNNSSPNLIDKFVACVATAATNPGATGGAATDSITLTTTELPAHTHTGPSHTHGITIDFDQDVATGVNTLGGGNANDNSVGETTDAGGTGATGSTGSGSAFTVDTLPPFYALAFIYKT